MDNVKGSCLCGAVSWRAPLRNKEVFFCHCSQCRRHHGSIGAYISSSIPSELVKMQDNIRWYNSSPEGERGFCVICGSKLFWRKKGSETLYPDAGSLDGENNMLHPKSHIFVGSKGDYYDITDHLPCYEAQSTNSIAEHVPAKKEPQHEKTIHRGRCLCGKVHFTITGQMRPIVYCHCGQCRHSHGHYPGYSAARQSQMKLEGEENIQWYRSSPGAQRGFCHHCGSSLFWQADKEDFISITAGCMDMPTDLKEGWHIYIKDKADWYSLTDGLLTFPGTTPSNAQF